MCCFLDRNRSALHQLFQQRLGLLQVLGVKPRGEPAVDLGQHLASLCLLALLLPQPGEVGHRAQLQRLCLLPASDLNGRAKISLRLLLHHP